MSSKILWPDNKKFAFTIFDDTDRASLDNIKNVYDFLNKLGFKTTKSIWIGSNESENLEEGITCNNTKYLNWLVDLEKKGFEIAYHNTTYSSSQRNEINIGLEKFKKYFDQSYITMANHSSNKENIYWGSDRLTGLRKTFYNILTLYKKNNFYKGHNKSSDFFWGDLCKKNITYVRNFVFSDINTLKSCPFMPYHDTTKPYVNYWFASSEGNNVNAFNKCLSVKNIDRLEKEGGACIMYTHLADGFYLNGKLSTQFVDQMKYLKEKNGWFVTVGTLLNFLKNKKKNSTITKEQRKYLEWKWLLNKIILGST